MQSFGACSSTNMGFSRQGRGFDGSLGARDWSSPQCRRCAGRAVRPQNVPAVGENWTMLTRVSGLNVVISELSIFPSDKAKVLGLLAELMANAEGTVPLNRSASS